MLTEIVLAGSGGQGIQFTGQVLARAAVRQGLKATYVPAYGVERRGGTSYCLVVLADEPIYAPVFTRPDVLLGFDQRGRNQYGSLVRPGGLIVANLDLAPDPAENENGRVELLPASALADEFGQGGAMNLVMLSAYLALTGAVGLEQVRTVVEERSRKKPELLAANLDALARGAAWIREHRP